VSVGVFVGRGVDVWVRVGVFVGRGVGVWVSVGVLESGGLGVSVEVGVGVAVQTAPGQVAKAVAVGTGVGRHFPAESAKNRL